MLIVVFQFRIYISVLHLLISNVIAAILRCIYEQNCGSIYSLIKQKMKQNIHLEWNISSVINMNKLGLMLIKVFCFYHFVFTD